MRNAIAMLPVAFAIYPMITGPIAPPTFVMMSREEASLVFVPVFLNAKENMVVNMMLSSRYRAKFLSSFYLLHNLTFSILIHYMKLHFCNTAKVIAHIPCRTLHLISIILTAKRELA